MTVALPELAEVARILGGEVHGTGSEAYVTFPTPGHSAKDRGSSFRFSEQAADGFVVNAFNGYDAKALKDEVRTLLGLPPFRPGSRGDGVVAQYVYLDAEGHPSRRVTRTATKDFWQQHWNGSGWAKGAKDCPFLPYRLPEVIAANTVFVVEGEKDADRLARLGHVATTNPMGAGKWKSELNRWFAGKHVFVIPDQDEKGLEHADDVARNLAPIAAEVRMVTLPVNAATGKPWKDVSDWLDADYEGAIVLTDIAEAGQLCARAAIEEAAKEPPPDLGARDAGDLRDPSLIPPRGWLLGNTFCRGFVGSVIADGGTGKTALRIAQALAMATARKLTGEHVFERSRVLLISFEDGDDELDRRIWAAMLHHRIEREDVAGWLFLRSVRRENGKLMLLDPKGNPVSGPLAASVRETIVKRNIDAVILDPFIKTHSLDENANSAVDEVMQLLSDMAIEHNIAVDVPHHMAKGGADPGNANKGRGASAMKDAGRLFYTLTAMSQEEAKAFEIPEGERRSYVRMDSAKVNIVPHMTKAAWFQLVGVELGNRTETYPAGDNVQTVEVWIPPATWDGLSTDVTNRILDEIEAGMEDGSRYSGAPTAKVRAAWKVVQKHAADKTEAQCREVIKTWLKNSVLESRYYDSPTRREKEEGLYVNCVNRPGTEVPDEAILIGRLPGKVPAR